MGARGRWWALGRGRAATKQRVAIALGLYCRWRLGFLLGTEERHCWSLFDEVFLARCIVLANISIASGSGFS